MTTNIAFGPFQRMIVISVFLLTVSPFIGLSTSEAGTYQPGEVLIQLRPGARSTVLTEHQKASGLRKRRTMNNGRLIQLSLPADMTVTEAVVQLTRDPDVVFAEPNYILSTQTTPDDPFFTLQWGLDNTGQKVNGRSGTPGTDIDALQAWELTQNDREITVAVIDTGCALDHPDLAERIWSNSNEIPDNAIDDDHNGYVDDIHGWDMADQDNMPWDASGHGTHVAGIIAAQSNNGLGISGVDTLARILPVRFMNGFETGTVADAISAIEYALNQGARIINCSWGTTGFSQALYQTMADADALFVCAAGNYHSDNDRVGFYPAGYDLDNVLSVAAIDQNDQLAAFSNFGHHRVNVAAPGVSIYSLGIERQSIWQQDFSSDTLMDWATGGLFDQWDVRRPPGSSNQYALSSTAPQSAPAGADSWARSPAADLSRHRGCQFKFSIMGASQTEKDVLYVEISTNGDQWQTLPISMGGILYTHGISGSIPNWCRAEVDLGAWDGMPQVYLRMHFRSDNDMSESGYFLDHLKITTSTADNIYSCMSGTSMAAAFVSGLGSLILSQHPDLTGRDVSRIIQNSADRELTSELAVSSGGRINAYNALVMATDYEPDHGGGSGGCFLGMLVDALWRPGS